MGGGGYWGEEGGEGRRWRLWVFWGGWNVENGVWGWGIGSLEGRSVGCRVWIRG